MNLMSITTKDIDMAVPISTASHLRFLIFLAIVFFAIDVVSFLLHIKFYFVFSFSKFCLVLVVIYLQDLFLIVTIAYGNRNVYTKVVRKVNIGRYNQSGSPGLRSLKSTAYIIPVNITPRNQSAVELISPSKGSTKSA